MSNIVSVSTGEPTGPTAPTPEGQRPAWLPEKFKSPEDMAAAYAQLEAKQGAGTPPAQQPQEQPQVQTPAKVEIPVPAQGSELKPYFEEFSKNGKLSEESFKALEKRGLPRDVVEMYVDGYKARQEQQASQLLSTVGGAEVWGKVTAWAQEALPVAEIEAFNSVLQSGNPQAIQVAMRGLKAQYDLGNGVSGRRVDGSNSGLSVKPFASQEQWLKAIDDPRYAQDPAYRKEVLERLSVSNI